MKLDTDDGFSGDYKLTPDEIQELDDLNIIRDYGRAKDLIDNDLVRRITNLQGVNPPRKTKKAK